MSVLQDSVPKYSFRIGSLQSYPFVLFELSLQQNQEFLSIKSYLSDTIMILKTMISKTGLQLREIYSIKEKTFNSVLIS